MWVEKFPTRWRNWIFSWQKRKTETEIFKMMGGLADDAKEGGGDRNRIKKILMQFHEEEEEYEARALMDAMQKNVNEAHARASEYLQRLLRKSRNTCTPWIEKLKDHRTSVTKYGKWCKATTRSWRFKTKTLQKSGKKRSKLAAMKVSIPPRSGLKEITMTVRKPFKKFCGQTCWW